MQGHFIKKYILIFRLTFITVKIKTCKSFGILIQGSKIHQIPKYFKTVVPVYNEK